MRFQSRCALLRLARSFMWQGVRFWMATMLTSPQSNSAAVALVAVERAVLQYLSLCLTEKTFVFRVALSDSIMLHRRCHRRNGFGIIYAHCIGPTRGQAARFLAIRCRAGAVRINPGLPESLWDVSRKLRPLLHPAARKGLNATGIFLEGCRRSAKGFAGNPPRIPFSGRHSPPPNP